MLSDPSHSANDQEGCTKWIDPRPSHYLENAPSWQNTFTQNPGDVLMAMSDEHKAALAQGRREARDIKRYLEALSSRRPGRPVTAQSLKERLTKLEHQIQNEANPLRRVELVQRRIDAEQALANARDAADIATLERGFVESAAGYSQRKGISYAAWREAGVPAAVLKQAGIPRTRST